MTARKMFRPITTCFDRRPDAEWGDSCPGLPSVGQTVPHGHRDRPDIKECQQKYCMDKPFLNNLFAREAKMRNGMSERRLEYVLVTGANWSGPIKDFPFRVRSCGG